MLLHKKVSSVVDNKSYEIRVLYDDRNINVVAFRDNHPVNGLRHQISVSNKYDVKELLEKEPVQELIEISKADIAEKRWERLLQTG